VYESLCTKLGYRSSWVIWIRSDMICNRPPSYAYLSTALRYPNPNHDLGNVHVDFGFSEPFCFRVHARRTDKSCNAAYCNSSYMYCSAELTQKFQISAHSLKSMSYFWNLCYVTELLTADAGWGMFSTFGGPAGPNVSDSSVTSTGCEGLFMACCDI